MEKYTISWHESARFHRYLVMLHPLPASDVVTVSKSQRLTVDNIVFTWRPRFENTVILCELHASDMFGTNSGVASIAPAGGGSIIYCCALYSSLRCPENLMIYLNDAKRRLGPSPLLLLSA